MCAKQACSVNIHEHAKDFNCLFAGLMRQMRRSVSVPSVVLLALKQRWTASIARTSSLSASHQVFFLLVMFDAWPMYVTDA